MAPKIMSILLGWDPQPCFSNNMTQHLDYVTISAISTGKYSSLIVFGYLYVQSPTSISNRKDHVLINMDNIQLVRGFLNGA